MEKNIPAHVKMRDQLKKLGLTQRAFAEETGYHANAVNMWMLGKRPPPRIVEVHLRLREKIHDLQPAAGKAK